VLNLIFQADRAGLGRVELEARSEFKGEIEGASGVEWNFLRRQKVSGKKTGGGLNSSMKKEIDSCSRGGEALRIGPAASAGRQDSL